jgi:hypothetical protein
MKWIVPLVALGLLQAHPALAQMGSADLPSVGESAVVIVNRGNIEVVFSVRPKDGEWGEYRLSPATNMKIVCDNCTTDAFEIYLATQGKGEVNYVLTSSGRYSIEWDSGDARWDVYDLE